MTDSLRDRIAVVAQNHVRCDDCTFAKTPQQRYLHFADAVIRELGLEYEWAPADTEHDGYLSVNTEWVSDRRQDAEIQLGVRGKLVARRCVTDWTADE